MKKLATTGTKGKTTIVRLINHVLLSLGKTTLSVDSDGVYLNGKKKIDKKDSINLYGLLPGKCPGRFLHLGYNSKKQWSIDYAILETVIGCYGAGLGYKKHDVGIFTNIFEDHIGGLAEGIKTQEDLTTRKYSFISKIETGGYFIYNMDDTHISKHINTYIKTDINRIGVTKDKNLYQKSGRCILISPESIFIKTSSGEELSFPLGKNNFSFSGLYEPAVYNLSFAFGGLLGILGEDEFISAYNKIKKCVNSYSIDTLGGRMVLLKWENRNILLDYAHEKNSLISLLSFANTLKAGKSIGIVRLSPEKDEKIYTSTGMSISPYADQFIVYDKIDGIEKINYVRDTGKDRHTILPGQTMHLLSEGIQQGNPNVKEIIYWKDAIRYGLEISQPGDIIVIIVNDSKKTANFVKRYIKNR